MIGSNSLMAVVPVLAPLSQLHTCNLQARYAKLLILIDKFRYRNMSDLFDPSATECYAKSEK